MCQVSSFSRLSTPLLTEALWKVSVSIFPEAEDAVTELLQTFFSQAASSYTDAETGEVIVSVYLPQRPKCVLAALLEGLARIKCCGLNTGTVKVSLRRLRRQNWAESWKCHFKPLEIGAALLIKPSWSKRRARKGQAMVVLDPGLSFGTGRHPTTAFCLQQLAGRRDPGRQQSFLDIGTGSGILAIAAAKLGYSPVEAFDIDGEAVRIARANARHNRVLHTIHIHQDDLTQLRMRTGRKHDLVCANLISDLLISERKRVVSQLKPDGALVVAGILGPEFPSVARACRGTGLRLVASRAENEWRSGTFVFA
jgi:ribosomal protein L11 methyltransferase